MQRLILVDHSITGLAGHHYEYAVHVLRAAEQAGYEPVLVTNRKFREKGLPWAVLPLFEFGFWPDASPSLHRKLAIKLVAFVAPRLAALRIFMRYSELALAWSSRYEWGKYLARRRGEGAPLAVRSAAVAAIVLFRAMWLIVAPFLLAPFVVLGLAVWSIYAAARFGMQVAHALARRQTLKPGRQALRAFIAGIAASAREFVHFAPAARRRLVEFAMTLSRGQQVQPQQQAAFFGRDAGRMLTRLTPRTGDVLFFPTISEHDLAGLSEYLDHSGQGLEATWHFLFRRNIYTGGRAGYAAQDAGLENLRLVFERVQRSVLAGRSFFYTDTDELTEQYDRLGIVSFHTLPVPHTYQVSDRARHSGPLRLTYLGDARTEKGFDLLPGLAASLEGDYLAAGKAQLVVQCNYNIPGGEPRVAVARGELESMPAGYFEFHKRPLTSEEYRRLLLTSDINLLCYDPANYYARSSGILVESLALGIPVIAPSGCWLSRQFLARQTEYVEELSRQMNSLGATSLGALPWRDEQNRPAKPAQGEFLRLHHGAGSSACVETPHGATHVVLRGEFGVGVASAMAAVTEIGWDGAPLSLREFSMEAAGAGARAAICAELAPNIPAISIALRTANASDRAWLSAFDVEFLRAPHGTRPPRGVVGLTYHSTAEIPALVRDLIDHYPHYQRTAIEFSKSWREYHNSDRLLREMETVARLGRAGGKALRTSAESVAV